MSDESRDIQIEKKAKWEAIISEWQTSGLTPTIFCKQANVSIYLFKKWRRLIEGTDSNPSNSAKWVAVNVEEPALRHSHGADRMIRVLLPNGIQLKLPAGVAVADLKTIYNAFMVPSC